MVVVVFDGQTVALLCPVEQLDHTGGGVGENDVRAQAAQVFENLRAVLEAAGGGLDDLVETTT